MAYTYATYSFGARFNPLFLVYVALLGMSTYAMFLLVPRLGSLRVTEDDWARLPRRRLVALFYGIVAVFALLWGSDIAAALVSGEPPRAALEAETPTSIIHVLDLAFLLPLGAVAATLLLKRRPRGVPLAGIFLVKGLTIAVAVLSMAAFVHLEGQPLNLPVAEAMLVTVILLAFVGARFAQALAPAHSMASRGLGILRP